MRVLVQRVVDASVSVDGNVCGFCSNGLLVFVGFTYGDSIESIKYLTNKILHLRIFPDQNGVMNQSVLEEGGSLLVVSQFTLYGDARKGNRPSYQKALGGKEAQELYQLFCQELKKYIPCQTGIFGADMNVSFTNVGPTTIWLEK